MAPKKVYSNDYERPHPVEAPESLDDIILEPRRFWAIPCARDSLLIGIFSGLTFGVWVASVKAETRGFQAMVKCYPKYGLLSFAGMTFLSLGMCGTQEMNKKLKAKKGKLQEDYDSDLANQPIIQRHMLDREIRRQKIKGRHNKKDEEEE